MNLQDILSRIDERRVPLGLSDTELSKQATGSEDLIRNWRRRLANGEVNAGASHNSLSRIAAILGVKFLWLLEGTHATRFGEFAEGDAERWVTSESGALKLSVTPEQIGRALAPHIRTLQIFQLNKSFVGLAMLLGDMLAVDANPEDPGETVIINFDELENGNPVVLLRRYQKPWLVSFDPSDPHPVLEATDRRAPILGSVEAIWRTHPFGKG